MADKVSHRGEDMKVNNKIKELIKIDLQKGKSLRNISKTYEVKKDVIRAIQDELNNSDECRQVDRQEVSNIAEEVSVTVADKMEIMADTEKVNDILSEYDVLMKMIYEYKQTKGQTEKQTSPKINKLVVELPIENDAKFRITQRVNDVIYNEFRQFADNNRQFTIKELLSQALKEFTERYRD